MARASLLGVLSWHLGMLLCVFCIIMCFLHSQTVREAVQVSAAKQDRHAARHPLRNSMPNHVSLRHSPQAAPLRTTHHEPAARAGTKKPPAGPWFLCWTTPHTNPVQFSETRRWSSSQQHSGEPGLGRPQAALTLAEKLRNISLALIP